jgi:hypothetical protein
MLRRVLKLEDYDERLSWHSWKSHKHGFQEHDVESLVHGPFTRPICVKESLQSLAP